MQKIINILSEVKQINDGYELSNEKIEQSFAEIAQAKVCIPVIGKFSAGKSALVNTILGYANYKLKTDITPETAVPTEIVYNEEEKAAIRFYDGSVQANKKLLNIPKFKSFLMLFDYKTETVYAVFYNKVISSSGGLKIPETNKIDLSKENQAMRKLICSAVLVLALCMGMMGEQVNAATKEELQQEYQLAVQENEMRKAEMDKLEAQAKLIEDQKKKFDVIPILFADVISIKPFIVKTGTGPLKMFEKGPIYYLIKNPKATFFDLGGAHVGEYVAAGQTIVTINGALYAVTILEDTPAEYQKLSKAWEDTRAAIRKLRNKYEDEKYRISRLSREIEKNGNYPSSWAEEEIESGEEMGIFPEDLLNNFQEYITREEFAKLAVRLLHALGRTNGSLDTLLARDGISLPSVSPFTDTADQNVLVAYSYGIVNGSGEGTFRPGSWITREEAATMLNRLIRSQKIAERKGEAVAFADMEQVSGWAKDNVQYISALQGNGRAIMGGSEGNFYPQKNYTREQAFLTMYRLYCYALGDQPAEAESQPEKQAESPNTADNQSIANEKIDFLPFANKTYFITDDDEEMIMIYFDMPEGYYWLKLTRGDTVVDLSINNIRQVGNRLVGDFVDDYGNAGKIILEGFSSNGEEDTVYVTIQSEQKGRPFPSFEKKLASTIAG